MNLFGFDMILFGSDMILLVFKVQYLSVFLVAILINLGVKNQAPQFSFEIAAGDLMFILFYEFADIIFYVSIDILEIISDFRSDPFTLIDLEILANSYMIACTDTQGFEEGENYASTISVEHTLGYDMEFIGSDMILFGYDMILISSIFQVHELLVLLVVGFINFGVTNKVLQVLQNC